MTILTSKAREQGASVVTTLPAEVARRLGISAGDELAWVEDGMGGFRVVPNRAQAVAALKAHAAIMSEYDATFRALAE